MTEDTTAGGILAFATGFNTPGKHDATGAFQPMADRFVRYHGGSVVLFDDRQPMHERAGEVLEAIERYEGHARLVCVAFFCHGWSRGIEAGFDLRARVGVSPRVLAEALAQRAGRGLIVPLYCCSTGRTPGVPTAEAHEAPGGDGGFADELRDELCRAGLTNCRVDAHDRDGHTTWNPYVRRFDGEGSPVGGVGGRYLVRAGGPTWTRWKHELKSGSLWARYPFYSTGALAATLAPPTV